MGFLLPGALAFALVAPVIVALYFLRLRRAERRVSSTFLWRQAVRDLEANAPWQRLRVSLLLILQLLALGAIVLGLARPYYLAPGTSGDVVVLLQASASMRATDVPPSRFAAAQAAVREMIDRLEASSAMTVVLMADAPRVLVAQSQDREALRAAVAGGNPTAGPANLTAALSLAASLARDRPSLQVVVVGDGLVESEPVGELPFPVRYVRIGTAADNVAIAAFAAGPMEDDDGGSGAGPQGALATVANYGPSTQETTLELYVEEPGGSRRAGLYDVRRMVLRPGEGRDVIWPELPPEARVLHARLSPGGALALDDDAWAVVSPAARARVLLVSAGNVFLERALRLSPAVDLAKTTPEAYSAGSASPADAASTPAVRGVAPGDAYDLYVFDGYLPATLPAGSVLVVGPPAASEPLDVGGAELVRRVEAASAEDELLRYVDLSEAHVVRARRLTPPAWARTVVASPAAPSPLPLLVAGEQDGRRVAVLAFDLHDSDLPLQPAFPILVQNLLAYLAPGAADSGQPLQVGQAIPVHLRPTARSAAMVPPDGRTVPVAPPFPPAPFADTAEPGVYALVQRVAGSAGETREETALYAVSFFSPEQSRLAPASALPVAGQSGPSEARSEVVPRELWQVGAALGLLALAAEWWVYHRG